MIKEYLDQIDLVLIMSVEPGFGGQKFMPEVLEKTKAVRDLINKQNLKVDVEIDGGINLKIVQKLKMLEQTYLYLGLLFLKKIRVT